MKIKQHAEGYQVPAQIGQSTAEATEVTTIGNTGQPTSGVVRTLADAINKEDYSDIIAAFKEKGIQFHDGTKWGDASAEIVRRMIFGSLRGQGITPVLSNNMPAAVGLYFTGTPGEEVVFYPGEAISDVPAAIEEAMDGFDFPPHVAKLFKYKRKIVVDGTEQSVTEDQLKQIARGVLTRFFSEEHRHELGHIALMEMTENGREMQAGFIVERHLYGAELSFVYAGASGDDVPEAARP